MNYAAYSKRIDDNNNMLCDNFGVVEYAREKQSSIWENYGWQHCSLSRTISYYLTSCLAAGVVPTAEDRHPQQG